MAKVTQVRYDIPQNEPNPFAVLAANMIGGTLQRKAAEKQRQDDLARAVLPGLVSTGQAEITVGKDGKINWKQVPKPTQLSPELINARTSIHKAAVSQATQEFGGTDMIGLTFKKPGQLKIYQDRVKELEDQMLVDSGLAKVIQKAEQEAPAVDDNVDYYTNGTTVIPVAKNASQDVYDKLKKNKFVRQQKPEDEIPKRGAFSSSYQGLSGLDKLGLTGGALGLAGYASKKALPALGKMAPGLIKASVPAAIGYGVGKPMGKFLGNAMYEANPNIGFLQPDAPMGQFLTDPFGSIGKMGASIGNMQPPPELFANPNFMRAYGQSLAGSMGGHF